jgi:hypothetical protein
LLQLSTDFLKWMVVGQIYRLSERMIIRQTWQRFNDFPDWVVGIRQPFEVLGASLRRLGRPNIFTRHAPCSAQ